MKDTIKHAPFCTPLRRSALIVWFVLSTAIRLPAQDDRPTVESILAAVSLDSLVLYVSELSGEIPIPVSDSTMLVYLDSMGERDTVWVADTLLSLPNRYHGANDAAAALLQTKLRSFGYDSVVAKVYPALPTTRNVVAFKPGSTQGGPLWILCAHYDSVVQAPGADDNASGTAVVLETARILADIDLEATVIFALWDSEEVGLYGADQFAAWAHDEALRIDGVLNVDMVGWDGDGDRRLQIHADTPLVWIAQQIAAVVERYGIGLIPDLQVPGTGRSDHVPFRNWGFPAVKVIEEEGDDFNPFYHSPEDVIEHFDLAYFHEVAKAMVATLAHVALSGTSVAMETDPPDVGSAVLEAPYPNPATGFVWFRYRSDGHEDPRIVITDVLGRMITVIADPTMSARDRRVRWMVPPDLPAGVYFATLQSQGVQHSRAFVVLR